MSLGKSPKQLGQTSAQIRDGAFHSHISESCMIYMRSFQMHATYWAALSAIYNIQYAVFIEAVGIMVLKLWINPEMQTQ